MGVPSGAVIVSGMPKKARKYSEGVSSSSSLPGSAVTGASLPDRAYGRRRPDDGVRLDWHP